MIQNYNYHKLDAYTVYEHGHLFIVYNEAISPIVEDSRWTKREDAEAHCRSLNGPRNRSILEERAKRERLLEEFLGGCDIVPFDFERFVRRDYAKIVTKEFDYYYSTPVEVVPVVKRRWFKKILLVDMKGSTANGSIYYYDLKGINTHSDWWPLPQPSFDLNMLVKK